MTKEDKLKILYQKESLLKEIISQEGLQNATLDILDTANFINPFTNRGTIKSEDQFIGRIRELDNIFARICNAGSVSVVGERRIGKSSLLYHIYLTYKVRLAACNNYNFQLSYLDMHNPNMKTPFYFIRTLFDNLKISYNITSLEKEPLIEFANVLESNAKNENMPVVLLDEFEEITKHKELFNDDFIDALRSFCNSSWLTLIVASKISLKELTQGGKLTSPFWNVFTTVELKEFICDNKINEVALFIDSLWIKKLKPAKEEKDFLKKYANRHPLKLQVISFWLLQNRINEYNTAELIAEIEKELNSFFSNISDTKISICNFNFEL